MGMGVSNWRLARAVSLAGQLGVVSGTAIDTIFVRRLQDGDADGSMRRALAHFPSSELAERLLAKYFCPRGRSPGRPYACIPMFSAEPLPETFEISVAANFAEVYLAKEGHPGLVGINLLHKIQMPTPSSLYGALLAGVDVVLMGAGIPRDIPEMLEKLVRHETVETRLTTAGTSAGRECLLRFDPRSVIPQALPGLKKPRFIPIISSAVLAQLLARLGQDRVHGFVVEGALAGGHNAPPRGAPKRNARGEPLYGERDEADLAKIRALGLPFWLAGSFASRERLLLAEAQGAAGVQIGTAFAFCRESGMAEEIKLSVLERALAGELDVFTDPAASPTGFPFKVVRLAGTVSERDVYAQRRRLCDLGYLRVPYFRSDGTLGYRCASENRALYETKGGTPDDTEGRKCLCNGLLAAIGLGQCRAEGEVEPAIVTAGDDVKNLARYLKDGDLRYAAADVIRQTLPPV